jgi:biopolymer transport protein ExbD
MRRSSLVIAALFVASSLTTLPIAACSRAGAPNANTKLVIDPAFNTLDIKSDGRVLWNGVSVSEPELMRLLQDVAKRASQPEIRFRPDVEASFDLSARVLNQLKASHVSNFGFVGNEAYSSEDSSAD